MQTGMQSACKTDAFASLGLSGCLFYLVLLEWFEDLACRKVTNSIFLTVATKNLRSGDSFAAASALRARIQGWKNAKSWKTDACV